MLWEIREAEADYCRRDPVYFVETYVKIEAKDGASAVQPFHLWPRQREALLSLHAHRLNIVLKARQLGLTWLALAYAAYTGLFYEGRLSIFLSRTEDGAKELIRRLDFILSHLPFLYPADKAPEGWNGIVYRATAQEIRLRFPGGGASVFSAYPSSPATARGLTADLLILDEWAFQQFAEDIWKAVYPTVNRPGAGKVIGLSTIERGTLFEELYEDPGNGFNKLFLPWDTDPRRDAAWYAQSLRAFGRARMLQEYPASEAEALTVPGGAFFEEVKEATHRARALPEGPVRRYIALDYGLDMLSAHWVAVAADGRACVYRELDAPDLTIGEAAEAVRRASGTEEIELVLAPPDLWNRSQESGKSRAQLFYEAGLNLTKVSNDLEAGCAAMKEWLRTGPDGPRLTLLEAAPNLLNCLMRIQKDRLRPDRYAKEPHALTHDVDSLRYFCVWWVCPAAAARPARKMRWEADWLEDYRAADEATRGEIRRRLGPPANEEA